MVPYLSRWKKLRLGTVRTLRFRRRGRGA